MSTTAEAPPATTAETNGGTAATASPADLSPKQRQVFDLFSTGKSAQEIADVMGITANGVHNHIGRLKKSGHIAGGTAARRSSGGTRRAATNTGDASKASALAGVKAALTAERKKLADVTQIQKNIKDLEGAFKALGGVEDPA